MRKSADGSNSRWADPDDAPAWTAEAFEAAEVARGDEVLKPATGTLRSVGRPRLAHPKKQVTLRLDANVVDAWRATGSGWQTRINDLLKAALASRP